MIKIYMQTIRRTRDIRDKLNIYIIIIIIVIIIIIINSISISIIYLEDMTVQFLDLILHLCTLSPVHVLLHAEICFHLKKEFLKLYLFLF